MPNRPNRTPPRSSSIWLRISSACASSLELGKPCIVAIEMSVGSENRRNMAGLLRRRDGLCESLGAGVELMIAECRRIISGH